MREPYVSVGTTWLRWHKAWVTVWSICSGSQRRECWLHHAASTQQLPDLQSSLRVWWWGLCVFISVGSVRSHLCNVIWTQLFMSKIYWRHSSLSLKSACLSRPVLDGCPGAGSQLLQPLQADSQSRERRRYQHIIRVFPYTPPTAVYCTHRHRAATVSNTHTDTAAYTETLRCNLSPSYIYPLLFADDLRFQQSFCVCQFMHNTVGIATKHVCAVFIMKNSEIPRWQV